MTAFRTPYAVKKERKQEEIVSLIPVYEPVYVNGEAVYASDPLDIVMAKGEDYHAA